MQLSFPSNKSVEMSFKVGIAGTQTAPQNVCVVLERDAKSLSFNATKTGEEWTAQIESPGTVFGVGQIKVSVNVTLNNRVFTPMKTTAEITDENIQPEVQEVKPEEKDAPVEVKQVEVTPEPEAVPEVKSVPPKKIQSFDLLSRAQQDAVKSQPKEDVKLVPPVRLQLLKSIEPGTVRKPAAVAESKAAPKQAEQVFKLKKTKIVFK